MFHKYRVVLTAAFVGLVFGFGTPLGVAQTQQKMQKMRDQRTISRFEELDSVDDIQQWVSLKALHANPFVYKGKRVGLAVTFEQMISATEGLFSRVKHGISSEINAVVVSDIPEGLMVVSDKKAIVVGVVTGQKEVSIPILGKVLVPLLKYVDIVTCSTGDETCNKLLNKKFEW